MIKKITRAVAVTGLVATLAITPGMAIAEVSGKIGRCLIWAPDGLGGYYCLFRM